MSRPPRRAERRATSGDAGEKQPSFEQALARLEEIVERLDDGNLPLEESLALFKEGTALAKTCRDQLADAEIQVKEALRGVDGEEADTGADADAAEDVFEAE